MSAKRGSNGVVRKRSPSDDKPPNLVSRDNQIASRKSGNKQANEYHTFLNENHDQILESQESSTVKYSPQIHDSSAQLVPFGAFMALKSDLKKQLNFFKNDLYDEISNIKRRLIDIEKAVQN